MLRVTLERLDGGDDMILRIDPASAQPPFEQLKSQLVEQMAAGDLLAGTRLPSVRRLAADLGLAPNTVARTYRELEAEGYVKTAGRNGTVVAQQDSGDEVQARAVSLTSQYVTNMKGLGLGHAAAAEYLRRLWAAE